jgi:SAM-dependent methyltransferase
MATQSVPRERWEQWQLAGNSAGAYERYLVPIMFAPWAERLADLAALAPGDRVLDVGCGTGIVARVAAGRTGRGGGTVVGLDANETMLTVARAAAAETAPAIDWRTGDAAALPFPDGAFEAVFCQQALQFLPDPITALAEMRRVVAPGGRVALAVWRPLAYHPIYAALADLFARHAGPDVAAMMRSPFSTWDVATLRGLIAGVGWNNARVLIGLDAVRFLSAEEFLRQEAASSPMAGAIAALPVGKRQAILRDLSPVLHDHTDDEGVVFPMTTYLALAHR